MAEIRDKKIIGNLRSSQLLSPFGIGQIINFPDDQSLMLTGLDKWDRIIENAKLGREQGSIDENEFIIREERLEKFFGVSRFKKPFVYRRDGKVNSGISIPAVRFPGWHYCLRCGTMEHKGLLHKDLPKCSQIVNGNACIGKLIPVRFIAACSHGHIQDVPFREWVHNGREPNDDITHVLKYEAGLGSGDLGSVFISCKTCNVKKSLAGLMNVRKGEGQVFDSALARIGLETQEENFSVENPNSSNSYGEYCKGYRPWLGVEGMENADHCGNHLHVLIRGGSNIHFANILSALYLPEFDEEIKPLIGKIIDEIGLERLKVYHEQDTSGFLLGAILENRQEVRNGLISKDDLTESIKSVLVKSSASKESPVVNNEEELKFEEYRYILTGRNTENSDFKAVVANLDGYFKADYLKTFFQSVVIIERLRETRVFTGFTRIEAEDGRSRLERMSELSNEPVNWLPASIVYGEGIFLQFNIERLKNWVELNGSYFENLLNRYHLSRSNRNPNYNNRAINASHILIHTFAHLLIKRLCFNCGYGSSSLRERIYVNANTEMEMFGVLIYTSSGDAEGSMGGLVRQGKEEFLANLVADAIEDARWCSADPVCSDVGETVGQGPDNVNGSACHNCCILAETSCEEFNMLLDRNTIVGSFNNPAGGYFDEWQ
jgi:hypothetical protein